MSTATEPEFYNPPQLAKRYGVAVEKIIRWILAGELAAMNLATKVGGRPRYKVTAEAVEAFEQRRAVLSPAPRTPRRKKTLPSGFVRHFRD
jgi:hypothetical protein